MLVIKGCPVKLIEAWNNMPKGSIGHISHVGKDMVRTRFNSNEYVWLTVKFNGKRKHLRVPYNALVVIPTEKCQKCENRFNCLTSN